MTATVPPPMPPTEALRSALPRVGGDISMRKLQVFWAVVHTGSLTRAAKLLSISQPTVSQQIAALEAALGNKLFERVNSAITPTEFGLGLMRHAEAVLRAAQELEDMVSAFGRGQLQTLRVAGVPSAIRALMPKAMQTLSQSALTTDFDLHEAGPAEVLEMLYARRINLALLGSNTVGDIAPGFVRVDLAADPYVLVVPSEIDLSRLHHPEEELGAAQLRQLRSTIQFSFGNQHSRSLQTWFDHVLPGNRTIARARSFELVVEMVRAGLGICVAPALSAAPNAVALSGVTLYRLNLTPRHVVAIMPKHYLHHTPYAQLLAALEDSAAALPRPDLAPEPPFIAVRGIDPADVARPVTP